MFDVDFTLMLDTIDARVQFDVFNGHPDMICGVKQAHNKKKKIQKKSKHIREKYLILKLILDMDNASN